MDGKNTAGDALLQLAAMENIFDFEGWKPVSNEALIAVNPEFIVMTARTVVQAGGLEKVLAMQAVSMTSAGQKRQIIVMDGMYLLGFGPRTIQAAIDLATRIHPEFAVSPENINYFCPSLQCEDEFNFSAESTGSTESAEKENRARTQPN